MVSLALCTGTIGTALASPLYPIYQQIWHLLPSHITYIFVAYMFGCLATLLFFGRTSNSLGFLRTLQIGLVIVICGLALSAVAVDIYWLMAGRFVIGIASGLISTSAMLGLITTIPDQHKLYAPQLSSVITVIGFGLGPFIGGLIAQFSDQPLISPYLPVIVVAFLCLLGLARLESPQFERQNFSIAPHLEIPESHYKTLFFIAGLTAFSAFGAVLVARWAWGLIRDTGRTLLDAEMDHPVVAEIREVIVGLPVQVEITDLHVWKVGRGKFACILALETQDDLNADQVRDALSIHEEVVHISVEINMPL